MFPRIESFRSSNIRCSYHSFDLPPTVRARPLSVLKPEKEGSHGKKRKLNSSKQNKTTKEVDDTPKSFARLMAFQRTGKRAPSSLDDGNSTKPKGKASKPHEMDVESVPKLTTSHGPGSSTVVPKILPGERLSDFAFRVDQALPLHSISRQRSQPETIAGLKPEVSLSKHNRRLQRMQQEWRAVDAKVKAQREEEEEELEDRREEESLLWLGVGNGKRKKGRRKNDGNVPVGDDDDPWKQLERKRREQGVQQRNLQDVVQAPPVLKPVKNIFKEKEVWRADTGLDGSIFNVPRRS